MPTSRMSSAVTQLLDRIAWVFIAWWVEKVCSAAIDKLVAIMTLDNATLMMTALFPIIYCAFLVACLLGAAHGIEYMCKTHHHNAPTGQAPLKMTQAVLELIERSHDPQATAQELVSISYHGVVLSINSACASAPGSLFSLPLTASSSDTTGSLHDETNQISKWAAAEAASITNHVQQDDTFSELAWAPLRGCELDFARHIDLNNWQAPFRNVDLAPEFPNSGNCVDTNGRPFVPLVSRPVVAPIRQADWDETVSNVLMHYNAEQYNDWVKNPTTPEWRARHRAKCHRKNFMKQRGNLLAEGTYGAVYNLRDKDTGKDTGRVLKMMKTKLDPKQFRIKADEFQKVRSLACDLYKEACLMMKIFDHERIVKCHKIHWHEDGIHLSLELEKVSGGSLAWWMWDPQHVDEGAHKPLPRLLSPPQTLQLISDVSEGLNHMHQRGWCHLDIKAGNILVENTTPYELGGNAKLRFKIADLGLASETLERGRDGQLIRNTVGTLQTWAPELFNEAHPAPIHPSADIFALGITVMESMRHELALMEDPSERLEYVHVHSCSSRAIEFIDWHDLVRSLPEYRPTAAQVFARTKIVGRLYQWDERCYRNHELEWRYIHEPDVWNALQREHSALFYLPKEYFYQYTNAPS